MIERIAIVGTGLIGASVGLSLRRAGFTGRIAGIDSNPEERESALRIEAVDQVAADTPAQQRALREAELIVLAVPVLAILDWMHRLAPMLGSHQLVTDTGSTKLTIASQASALFNTPATAHFLPGHPMAGKESGGAALAEATLFDHATWLFTPIAPASSLEAEWRDWIVKFGSRIQDLEPARHDQVCAWVSHLPQFVATALSALLAEELQHSPELAADFEAIGGRALREMTRLGASPYSMWRDVALTNTEPVAATLFALEQRVAHLRENLRTPELREEFHQANTLPRRRP